MNKHKFNIYYNEEYVNKNFKYHSAIKDMNKLLKEIGSEVNDNIEASVFFVSSDQIKELNKEHRDYDKTTDVLSFPHNERDGKNLYIGDIIINLDIIDDQAESINSDPLTEVKFLTMHGLLHLIGYDHLNKKDEEDMCLRQRQIFTKLKIRDDLKNEEPKK